MSFKTQVASILAGVLAAAGIYYWIVERVGGTPLSLRILVIAVVAIFAVTASFIEMYPVTWFRSFIVVGFSLSGFSLGGPYYVLGSLVVAVLAISIVDLRRFYMKERNREHFFFTMRCISFTRISQCVNAALAALAVAIYLVSVAVEGRELTLADCLIYGAVVGAIMQLAVVLTLRAIASGVLCRR